MVMSMSGMATGAKGSYNQWQKFWDTSRFALSLFSCTRKMGLKLVELEFGHVFLPLATGLF